MAVDAPRKGALGRRRRHVGDDGFARASPRCRSKRAASPRPAAAAAFRPARLRGCVNQLSRPPSVSIVARGTACGRRGAATGVAVAPRAAAAVPRPVGGYFACSRGVAATGPRRRPSPLFTPSPLRRYPPDAHKPQQNKKDGEDSKDEEKQTDEEIAKEIEEELGDDL